MGILSCECAPVMSKTFHHIDEYHPARYEIVSHEAGTLCVRIYAALASGEYYIEGFAAIVNGCLYLSCATRADDTVAIELVPWELTYAIRYDGELNLDFVYFQKKPLHKRLKRSR